jgi:hypothetical protein
VDSTACSFTSLTSFATIYTTDGIGSSCFCNLQWCEIYNWTARLMLFPVKAVPFMDGPFPLGIGKGRAIGFNKRPWSLRPG